MAEGRIRHVDWRGGRPRFSPGPGLRAQGYKASDLKHADGRWFSQGEALDWSNAFRQSLQAAKEQSAPAPLPASLAPLLTRPSKTYPLSQLFEDWFKSPRVKNRKDGSPRPQTTIKDYKQKARVLEQWDPDMWASEVSALDQPICYGLYEDLWQAKGLATARGALTILGMALSWGMRTGRVKGLAMNPARDLDMQAPKARARFITREEFLHLVATAEGPKFNRVDFADMLFCGVWTSQRQFDRLNLQLSAFRKGRFVIRQSKTGAIVNPPVAPAYKKRMDAAADRRKAREIISPYAHLNESTWAPWNHWTYRQHFSEIRAEAAKTMPTCSTIMEKDLRATGVTWMALANCTLPQICAVSGHSLQGAYIILKHYLALHPEMATTAIGNLVDWYENGSNADMAI